MVTNSKSNASKLLLAGAAGAGLLVAGGTQVIAHADSVKVQKSDTVWALSQKYGVSVKSIESLNNINQNSHLIFVGQDINIPGKTDSKVTKITVKSGDSLSVLAEKYGVSVNAIMKANNLSSSLIIVGQSLTIPAANGSASQASSTYVPQATQQVTVQASSAAAQTVVTPAPSSAATTYVAPASSAVTSQSVTSVAPSSAVSSSSAVTSQAATSVAPSLAVSSAASSVASSSATTTTTQNTGSVTGLARSLANNTIPYVWGGKTTSGFDCSGFVSYVYQHSAGISLPSYTVAMESYVTKKSVSAAQPGDLLFWGSAGSTYHVAIYLGNNQYANAPTFGQNAKVSTISSYFYPSFAGSVR
ncbi:DUF1175 family protein [Pediococcus pentosaceus]|uniref:peptidoglycan endopeptidase n=1 Tax=Pediococcus pentosaceus TaxID=1255 RepID=UPI0018A12D5A|nr:peptidoglycan endopeptidase [Pediococcus pentosaceus]MBF7133184.1 DUF1175 family protein [Pediococcus pentosaceus]